LEERREVGEGCDEDDSGVGFEGRGFGGWVHEVRGEVCRGGVCEVEGARGGYGGAEALAEEYGAGGGVGKGGLNVGEERDGVGD
jgi:hypothetical protein